MSAELGKSTDLTIYVENPTNMDVHLKYHNTNVTNFEIQPKDINIKPFDEFAVKVIYTPTQVGIDQEGQITLTSQKIGDFSYIVLLLSRYREWANTPLNMTLRRSLDSSTRTTTLSSNSRIPIPTKSAPTSSSRETQIRPLVFWAKLRT